VNLSEGTRRLALFLGVVGAIFGGFASYLQLESILSQRARHDQFERAAALPIVQKERQCRLLGYSSGCSQIQLPPGAVLDKPSAESLPPGVPTKFSAAEMEEAIPLASELSTGNIKTIDWNKGMSYTIESIETRDGQTHYPTPAPNPWLYPFVAILPLLGFALPWGLVRAVGWVGAGFVTGSK
jgi:hypothetical protein